MNYKERKLNIRDGIICIRQDQREVLWQALWIGLFAIAYWLRDMAGISVPDIVFTGICAAAFLICTPGTSMGIYIFTTVLVVPHNEIRFVYMALMVGKMFFAGKVKMSISALLISLGFVALELVNILMFSNGGFFTEVYDLLIRMLPFLLPLIWFDAEFDSEDYHRALMCYVAGVMLGGTITLLLTARDAGWDALLSGEYRRMGEVENTTDAMLTSYNDNQLASMFAISTAILVGAMERKRISKLLTWAFVCYSLFVVVLTRSRSGLILLGLVLLIYYWILIFQKKKVWNGLWTMIAAAAVVLLIWKLLPGPVDAFMDRFEDQEDITNGRADLFVLYLKAWSADAWCFFFGYGIGSYENVVDIYGVPHNSLTDILICWGLVGFVLIVVALVMFARKHIKRVSRESMVLALLPGVMAIVSSMGGQYLTAKYPHMRLCFLFLAICAFAKKEEKHIA